MGTRQILFKAKRIDNKGWVIGDLLHSYENGAIIVPVEGGGAFSVDPSTVCQFTGLVDMNGNDIWEHDYIYVVLPYILSGEVIYDNELCRYMIEPDKESSSNYTRCFSFAEIEEMSSFDEDIEIYAIGNKFDRKEGK